jgi:hypothetical protein
MKVSRRVRSRTLQDLIVLDDAVEVDIAAAQAAVETALRSVYAGRSPSRKEFRGAFWLGDNLQVYEFHWDTIHGLVRQSWASKRFEAGPQMLKQLWERVNGYGSWNPDDNLAQLTWDATWEEAVGLGQAAVTEALHRAIIRRRDVVERRGVIRQQVKAMFKEPKTSPSWDMAARKQTRFQVGETLWTITAAGVLVRGDPDIYMTVSPATPLSRDVWGSQSLKERQQGAQKRRSW